jgi:hypothetical protein
MLLIEKRMLLVNSWLLVRKPIISFFILFHVLTLVLWVVPPFPLYWSILPPFRQYICQIGFWNTWNMFCHPKNWNVYLTADVELSNGQISYWEFPRMEKLSVLTRAQKEHYRKWAHEYVNEDAYKFVLPDACRFIARQISSSSAQPIRVSLSRHWTWIQPPPGFGKPLPTGEFQYGFYTYDVKPEDLK